MGERRAQYRFSNDLRRRAPDHPAQTALTPACVLAPVREALGGVIDLDPCTIDSNPVGARTWWTVEDDGLAQAWPGAAASIYVNPPYGEARTAWVERCMAAGARGARVALLIPAAMDTRIVQRAMATATAAVFVRGRLKFGVPRPNGRQVAASHPSLLLGWGTDLAPCAHLGVLVTLRDVGEVHTDG